MGRGGRNVRAKKVFQTVAKSLGGPIGGKDIPPPAWFKALQSIPPSEVLTRPVALRHSGAPLKTSNMFKPTRIEYPEDQLRKEFYRDHPWELARPRIIMELDGHDAKYLDWSKGLRQRGMALSGESVVQRQLWLMNHKQMNKQQAYDKARKEFYALRQEEDIGRRVAIEEARYVGAYFGKNNLQVGMDLEDKTYEDWKAWAQEEMVKMQLKQSEAYTSFGEPQLEPEEEAVVS
ncbi:mitochondrial ribosomal protein S25-domain-containing protein [Coniochaeta sp. 2T2.1]|nr:mitochondrial ribosomal protein S25-domain-containing protein [Coniochaeta sp. 2T2.1]